ncbi:CU044_2847 family protein [Methanosarcina sp. UBA289]|uniref:CU044_2847 family protein n=2 Tax=unclassified Methanosarcina TaxID=2644672 RepID=UPI0025D25088|nr:CU044_2847 family protein [Methanosarcina sp. UBA289]
MGGQFLDKVTVDEKVVENSGRSALKAGLILAELGHAPGTIKKFTLVSPKALEEKSTESLDNAMLMIKEISKKVVDNLEETPAEFRPSQVELTFNLLLTMSGKAVITKSENEKNLKVMLTWKDKREETEKEIPEK